MGFDLVGQDPDTAGDADAVAVQCTYFEKSADRNWLVPIHQDLAIPVARRVEHPALRGWSHKEGSLFVQPPADVLAQLVAVRTLDCKGQGSLSDVLDGIAWVKKNAIKPAVANMSLGGGYSKALNAAVQDAINSGITFVVAAATTRGESWPRTASGRWWR